MQISNTPLKWTIPFANGDSGKVEVPATTSDATRASLTLGFPPLTRVPPEAGGVPPQGEDFNGAMNQVARIAWWKMAGGAFPYDAAFAANTNINGYPQGAILASSDLQGAWTTTVDNNTVDPDATGTNWVPVYAYGTLALTGQTGGTTTLTPAQAMKKTLTVAGALTSNLTIIVPAWTYNWMVTNNTTGAFTMTVKTAAGAGTIVPQTGTPTAVTGDGTNVNSADYLRADLASTATGKGASLVSYLAGTVKSFLDSLSATGSSVGAALIGFLQAGTGAVARTVQGKLGEVVSVKDFGATGNGVTDDTAAVQAAINASTSNNRVYFPPGIYLCGQVNISQAVFIYGARSAEHGSAGGLDGAGGSKIVPLTAATSVFVRSTSTPARSRGSP